MATVDVYVELIEWDREVDGELDMDAHLPGYMDRLTVEVEDATDLDEVETSVANTLSDTYGFCVYDVQWYFL